MDVKVMMIHVPNREQLCGFSYLLSEIYLLSSKTTFLSLMVLLRYRLRFGSQKIFLLLNDSSHDPHFSACQNIETLDWIQKISNFSLPRVFQIFDSKHGSPEDYSDFFFVFLS